MARPIPALLLLLVALLPAPLAAQGAQALDRERLTELSRQVDDLFREWHRPDSPGAAVLVMRGGEVVHAKGYGMANLEHGVPNGPGTVFDIASVSKQFAAFAVARLAEDGVLSLDDDVRLHLPELPDFGQPIRIRHLVHHTSGLRDWPGTLRMAGWDYEDVMSYEQILNMAFHQRELNFPPGSEYAYSNTGYNLLAEVVSRVTGRTFREWTAQNVFEPLGMRSTHFHDDWREVVPGRAESYRPGEDGTFQRAISNLTAIGSSSLFTTVEDLARWIGNFDAPVVGGERVVARMHERGVLTGGDTIRYAFGLNVGEYRGATAVSHGGSWAGYRSTFLRFPDEGLAVVVLGNVSNLSAGSLGYRIADLYLEEVLAPVPQEEAAPDPSPPGPAARPHAPTAAELREYEGEYRSPELHTSYRVRVAEGGLVAEHFRTGTVPFRPLEPDLFQAPWFGRVEFVRDDAGRIEAFTASSIRIRGLRFERVP